MIKFNCPKCKTKISVKDEYAGKRGRCPECKSAIQVPKPYVPDDSLIEEIGSSASLEQSDTVIHPKDPFEQPQWFYTVAGQKHGPFDTTVLADMITQRKLNSSTKVWKNGMATWEQASLLPELSGYFQQAPPPSDPSNDTYKLTTEPIQMKDCPYCGEEILAKAKKCKHCEELLYGRQSKKTGNRRPKTGDNLEATTDVFAIITFACAMLAWWVYPIVCVPIAFVCSIISYYRIKEHGFKGKWLRIAGYLI